MRVILAVFYLLFSTASFADTEVISNNSGGVIREFLGHYSQLRKSGERVVISGYCWSACTLVTHYIPPERACVTRGTVFGFHSAYHEIGKRDVYAAAATHDMWLLYPYRVQRLIRAKGWNGLTNHPNLVKIPGEAIYPLCT